MILSLLCKRSSFAIVGFLLSFLFPLTTHADSIAIPSSSVSVMALCINDICTQGFETWPEVKDISNAAEMFSSTAKREGVGALNGIYSLSFYSTDCLTQWNEICSKYSYTEQISSSTSATQLSVIKDKIQKQQLQAKEARILHDIVFQIPIAITMFIIFFPWLLYFLWKKLRHHTIAFLVISILVQTIIYAGLTFAILSTIDGSLAEGWSAVLMVCTVPLEIVYLLVYLLYSLVRKFRRQ
jgi:hypothetical protein